METTVPINYLAVIAATVLSMVIGMLWYGPLFGKVWTKEMGFSKSDMEKAKKKGMQSQYGLMMLGSLVMAYVLAHSTIFASSYTKTTGVSAGVMSGIWNWLGFVMPVTLSAVLWEGKKVSVWMLNNGYYLVTLVAMGVLLSVWK